MSSSVSLAPETRPSTRAETRLQRAVFLSVLDGRPNEKAKHKSRGENSDDCDQDGGGSIQRVAEGAAADFVYALAAAVSGISPSCCMMSAML
jgi:hypothetical protein